MRRTARVTCAAVVPAGRSERSNCKRVVLPPPTFRLVRVPALTEGRALDTWASATSVACAPALTSAGRHASPSHNDSPLLKIIRPNPSQIATTATTMTTQQCTSPPAAAGRTVKNDPVIPFLGHTHEKRKNKAPTRILYRIKSATFLQRCRGTYILFRCLLTRY